MIAVFQKENLKMVKRFHHLMPQGDGDYLLSLVDGTPLFIAWYVSPISSNLHYK